MEEHKKIPLFDEFGQLIWTDREEFRLRVIPENIQAEWDHPENLYAFAVQLYRDGFLNEALQSVNRVLELTDRGEEPLLLKGLILQRFKSYPEAETILKECIDRFPDRGVAYTYLARLYGEDKKIEDMVDALHQGLKREPNQGMALRMLASSTSDSAQAARLLHEFTEDKEAWWPQLELGRVYLQDKRIAEAIQQFQFALDSTQGYREVEELPEWVEEMALMTVTTLLFRHGLRQELIQIAEKYWTPQFLTPYAGLDYVAMLEEKGEITLAIDVLQKMVSHCGTEYHPILELRIHHLDKKARQ
ncbi:tetratricopeptide repeat protein [Marininema halotolerans]|uniref:Tetratricopeptide repeat-containing protein n=1 Tax=Marininema halotolerans TaxID=1155944 RepID=A0A1I6Q3H3_9BACL|nr:tetratricopeptide repeat protein [Marininema halotolerans]SFS47041.1 Tetratricopeptide repeat-containing protein [Marininema halotolerans]